MRAESIVQAPLMRRFQMVSTDRLPLLAQGPDETNGPEHWNGVDSLIQCIFKVDFNVCNPQEEWTAT